MTNSFVVTLTVQSIEGINYLRVILDRMCICDLYSNGSIQARRLENNWKSKKEIRARMSTPSISVWNFTRPIPANSSKKSQGNQIEFIFLHLIRPRYYQRYVNNSIVKYNYLLNQLLLIRMKFYSIDYRYILIHYRFLWFYFVFKMNLIIR